VPETAADIDTQRHRHCTTMNALHATIYCRIHGSLLSVAGLENWSEKLVLNTFTNLKKFKI